MAILITLLSVILALKIGAMMVEAARIVWAADEKALRQAFLINFGGPIAGSLYPKEGTDKHM